MKTDGLKSVVLASLILLLGAETLRAQPTASPSSFNFTYQVNSTTLPAAAKLTATLSKSTATGYTLTAAVSPLGSWLTVTPSGGASPLTLTVTVNPTGLSPQSYSGIIYLGTNPATSVTTVPVTLSISNPPSSLAVNPDPHATNYTPGVSGANPVLAFNYTTGDSGALPTSQYPALDVTSNGGTIPFTATAASGSKTNNWLRINVLNQLPNLQTSGVALSGNYVPICVSIDYNALITLNVAPYAGTITFTNIATGVVAAVVSVSLNVSAGPPTIASIFPTNVTAAPSSGRVPPVITIYGDNFFSNSSVQLTPDGAQPLPALAPTLLSRQVLQATLNPSYLTKPGTFTLTVANPSTLSNPTPQAASVAFAVTDGTVPQISAILNAASYQSTATWKGTIGLDPVPVPPRPGSSAVSPRELVAIFGQNIGPGWMVSAQTSTISPTTFPSTFPLEIPFPYLPAVPPGTSSGTVTYKVLVRFVNHDPAVLDPITLLQAAYISVPAPIIMVSSNQINAVVPVPPSAAFPAAPPIVTLNTLGALNAWVQVVEAGASASPPYTDWFPITFVPEVPGVFTFGGLGLGQAAVLNNDAAGGVSINSTKNPAPKGSTISLYVTGMGDLMSGSTITVTDANKARASAILPLIINPAPAITASLIPTGTGVPIPVEQNTFSITALQVTGGTPPYTWSVTSGLPPGMGLSSSGLLNGVPTAAGGTSYTLAVSVTDSTEIPLVAVATYAVNVTAPTVTVTTTGLVPGVETVAYPSTTLTAIGGKGPYTWSSTGLGATGLSLSAAGVMTGTPIAAGSPHTLTFTATDSSGVASTAATITLNVLLSGSMTIITQSLPNGVVNAPYVSTALQQQGGTLPISWSPTSLPPGLSLSPMGFLSGTPTTAASAANIGVLATDSSGTPKTAAFTYKVNIAPPVSISTLTPLPSGTQNVIYPALLMQATGGAPPYTWTATGLPLGMTMSPTPMSPPPGSPLPGSPLLWPSGVLSGVPGVPFYLPLPDGAVALGAVSVADSTCRVEINGQAAVVSYAGASQGSVAGLMQINAIVPPTAPTGAAIPLVVYIGPISTARASQLSVTLAVQ
jgi:uncharacterized protein (TIGR03437 family)